MATNRRVWDSGFPSTLDLEFPGFQQFPGDTLLTRLATNVYMTSSRLANETGTQRNQPWIHALDTYWAPGASNFQNCILRVSPVLAQVCYEMASTIHIILTIDQARRHAHWKGSRTALKPFIFCSVMTGGVWKAKYLRNTRIYVFDLASLKKHPLKNMLHVSHHTPHCTFQQICTSKPAWSPLGPPENNVLYLVILEPPD